MVNNTVEGRGKLDWASDNQSTAAPFVLVYRPGGRPEMRSATRLQIGSFNAAGDVVTVSSPAANAVNLLVETVILNYLALHGRGRTVPDDVPVSMVSAPPRDSLTHDRAGVQRDDFEPRLGPSSRTWHPREHGACWPFRVAATGLRSPLPRRESQRGLREVSQARRALSRVADAPSSFLTCATQWPLCEPAPVLR